MKLYKYYILIFLLLLPIKVNAATVSLTCPGTPINANANFKCNIIGQGFETVSMNLELPSGFTIINNTPGKGYQSTGSGTDLAYKKIDSNASDIIGSLNLKAISVTTSSKYNISLKNIKINSTTSLSNSVKSVTINPLTTSTTTTTTKINQTEYTVSLNPNNGEQNKTLTCTTSSNQCSVDLSSVTPPQKTGFNFTGWGNDEACQSGNTNIYTATKNSTLYGCFVKNNGVDENTLYLKSLLIEGQELEFSKFKFDYELKVLYDVTELKITALPDKATNTVTILNNTNLAVGENIVTITLNEGQETSNYKIKVTRLNEGEEIIPPANDATLKTVRIAGYNIDFSPTNTNYKLKVKYNTTSLSISAETNDPKAKSQIENADNLKKGSVVKITVTAEDGTTNIYKFNIVFETILEHYLIYIVAVGVFILAVVVFIIISIKRRKNKDQNIAEKKKDISTPNNISTPNEVEVLNI